MYVCVYHIYIHIIWSHAMKILLMHWWLLDFNLCVWERCVVCDPSPKSGITEFAFELQSGGNFAGTIIIGDYFLWNCETSSLPSWVCIVCFWSLHYSSTTKEEELMHLHQRFPSFVENKDHLAELWYNVVVQCGPRCLSVGIQPPQLYSYLSWTIGKLLNTLIN